MRFVNTTQLKVRWDLKQVSNGSYDVVAQNTDNSTTELLSVFSVSNSTGMQVRVESNAPQFVRLGSPVAISCNFVNSGNIDIPYLKTYILVPTTVEPTSIANTSGLIKKSELGNFFNVPFEDYSLAYGNLTGDGYLKFNLR